MSLGEIQGWLLCQCPIWCPQLWINFSMTTKLSSLGSTLKVTSHFNPTIKTSFYSPLYTMTLHICLNFDSSRGAAYLFHVLVLIEFKVSFFYSNGFTNRPTVTDILAFGNLFWECSSTLALEKRNNLEALLAPSWIHLSYTHSSFTETDFKWLLQINKIFQ